MADRTVVYRLQADATQFKAQMAAAGASTNKLGTNLDGTTAKGQKFGKGLDALGLSAGTVAVAGIGAIVSKTADFEQAMSGVQAATHETASAMADLKQAAMDAGAETSFSATEAAAGIENLAKAGISTADILDGGLTGALDLAAAGGLDVAQSAEIAATALTQFSLSGEDIPHVADLLAAGAGKAQGEVTDLAAALNQSGLVAAQMGLSIEETTGSLAAFASAGLLGSDAGTSLKTMLLRLANPSKEASDAMERFGISAYDAQGNMLPMADIAGQLQTAFKGQSQATRDAALATIFGSDAIRAANVLYSEGATGITDWTAKVDDAGFAAETAAIKLDNLRGDLEYLLGSIETGMIGSGEKSQDSLRGTTQAATELVDVLNEINANPAVSDAWSTMGMGGVTPDVFALGLSNLGKTRDAIFGVDDATKEAAAASEDKAEADALLAAETTRLGQAATFTAEELKVQEEALKDAREAATETAQGFVNLGESLNDGKKSLGQWLSELEKQDDALRNFRKNAESAAENGLRNGLISALREAGPEGAMRMKQLANATGAEIKRANKAWQSGQTEINKYVEATTEVPEDVSSSLRIDGVEGALASLALAQQALTELDNRDVEAIARITTVYKTVNSSSDALPNRRREAAGGPIFGPGTATSDDIPAMLSNGEYVIRAAAVDHYGLDTFDRMNAMHLASGGSADKKKRKRPDGGFGMPAEDEAREDRREKREEAREAREEIMAEERQKEAAQIRQMFEDILAGEEKATREWIDAAEEQRSAAQSIADGIASAMASIASSATSPFQSNPFADSGAWSNGGGWQAALQGDIDGLAARGELITQLSDAGISAEALEVLMAEGSNTDIAALIASGQLATFDAMIQQRADLTNTVGAAAGQAAYGTAFAEANAEVAKYTAELAVLNAAMAAIVAEISPVSTAAQEGYDRQGATLAAAVSGAIVNGTNTVARRGNR